uniref:Uncharacterized protein n=1 Tax=Cyanothece sp. (strain PCC 7425 / ATCC 29141) TaxID=395961 RepID=B8HRM0_CYAP4
MMKHAIATQAIIKKLTTTDHYGSGSNGEVQRRQTTSNLAPVVFEHPLLSSVRWEQLLLSIVEGEILLVLPTRERVTFWVEKTRWRRALYPQLL